MEKPATFGVNGGIRLPIGYRFCPTDEELVIHYLRRKVFAQPLPISIIPEFDVFQTEPWGLPGAGDLKEAKYFFSIRKGHVYGNINKRVAGSGYWKSFGKDNEIVASWNNRLVGVRKRMIFCKGKRSSDINNLWVMHELTLVASGTPSYPFKITLGDWAVYRIFQMKRKLPGKGLSNGQVPDSSETQKPEDMEPSFIDFTVKDGSDSDPPPPCSPSLSEGSENGSA